MTQYQRYRVRQCMVEISAMPYVGDSTVNAGSAVQLIGTCISEYSTGASGATPVTDIMEAPYQNGFLRNDAKAIMRISATQTWNIYNRRTVFDIDTLTQQLYEPTVSSSPDEYYELATVAPNYPVYFNIWTGSELGGASTPGHDVETVNVYFAIRLTYLTEFMDPYYFTIN